MIRTVVVTEHEVKRQTCTPADGPEHHSSEHRGRERANVGVRYCARSISQSVVLALETIGLRTRVVSLNSGQDNCNCLNPHLRYKSRDAQLSAI